jgi:hypothetical protein
MCSIKDAERYCKLAKIQQNENDIKQSSKSYLEAASIYVLQAEIAKNKDYIKKANWCYRKSKEVLGETFNMDLTKQELAQRTLNELNQSTSVVRDKEKKRVDILNLIKLEIQ